MILLGQAKPSVSFGIFAGQSNSDGRGFVKDAPPHIQEFYRDRHPLLQIFHKEAARQNCTITPNSHTPHGGEWWELGLHHDEAARRTHQTIGDTASTVGIQSNIYYGPEIGYGYAHAQAHPDKELRIVKAAIGGAGIESDWGITHAGPSSLWRWFRNDMLAPAWQRMQEDGITPASCSIFWMQGETDACTETDAALYGPRLHTLIERMNTELPFKPDRIIIGGLAMSEWYEGRYGEQVVAAQMAVAAAHPNTVFLATDGSDGRQAIELAPDKLHYNAAGMDELGQRVYEAASPSSSL